jgi:glycerophosphoryl diester phosphodiesterase
MYQVLVSVRCTGHDARHEACVQVTSDGVPVIFHDDYIVHGPLHAPRRSLCCAASATRRRGSGCGTMRSGAVWATRRCG